jgi:hypothetical protein
MNVLLHLDNSQLMKHKWIADYNVDGFHCMHVEERTPLQWQTLMDSLVSTKPVIILAEDGNDLLKHAGFTGAVAIDFTHALERVMFEHESVDHLDTAVAGERGFFTQQFPAVRRATSISALSDTAQRAAFVTAWTLPGVPTLSERDLEKHTDLIAAYLDIHLNSPVLQYGTISFYNDESDNVYTGVREFEGKRILFAINLSDKPAEYKWPSTFVGNNTSVMFGMPITRNGGQELPPYGYQFLSFENIVGYDALDARWNENK